MDFSKKIHTHATTFEAWHEEKLIGLVSSYFNDRKRYHAYINSVSTESAFTGKKIATKLMKMCLDYAHENKFKKIGLEVTANNPGAIHLYKKFGFLEIAKKNHTLHMEKNLSGKEQKMTRDYNQEIKDNDRKYAYSFDFDVMHPYMLQSFEPFFKEGSLLELGCFKGDFTKRFTPYFNDITCVEASDEAIEEAKTKVNEKVVFIHSKFEDAKLPKRYDNIVLTHVLEHLDDPIKVLKRINDEWLADNGRFFLVTPNAMAPSRQIAVKMGLITHNTAVTPAEAEHGHKITYSLDTLERDAREAGLKIIHRSGIFFKALANFQWDRLLQTDIISKEYLDGCYELGQQYPELCSSIFLMCEK